MWKHVRNLSLIVIVLAAILLWFASRPDVAKLPVDKVSGTKPELTNGREQRLPTINVADVDRWKAGEAPVTAAGLKVERFAEGLDHPRNMIVLPNGDVLVAETNSPPKSGGGITGFVARWMMNKAGAGVPSANRISLLRDSDGDGKAETKSAFITGLNSPFGMALVGGTLYVANTDAILAFPYKEGDQSISVKGEKIADLNAIAPNMHWTRNLVASADGKKLYVAVGSNSNIAEGGIEIEKGRAQILEFDIAKRKLATYASGLRNPVGMDWDSNGQLWAVVNERDMLGSDMVPDYLTQVEFGADFGWPQHYWGGYTDARVEPKLDNKRQYERRPDYAMGPHVAALGLAFADRTKLGEPFAKGAFVARHGSWNRKPASGYDVVFVAFKDGRPMGTPQNVLTGFLDKDGNAQGRPTMLTTAKDGALLVSDDVGNIIWRVSSAIR
jgi:glucose/arabinose dehydrogenase